ncbi:hypothetical protein GGS26DRAFT_535849 [Hypomontagnella submonticulosa]|nr:hypothetical protein GGS26DRAFT_535849 [Hypomontagnella submonticulosa]
MLFSLLPLVTAISGILSRESQPTGPWTLFNSTISCDTVGCDYNFFVHKENSGETVHCRFNTSEILNPRTLLIDRVCHSEPLWTVSLSWAPDHSVIISIADEAENTNAFYGFESWEIIHARIAPNKTEWAWEVGQLPSPSYEITRPTTLPQL